jgi:hypothetical protein
VFVWSLFGVPPSGGLTSRLLAEPDTVFVIVYKRIILSALINVNKKSKI